MTMEQNNSIEFRMQSPQQLTGYCADRITLIHDGNYQTPEIAHNMTRIGVELVYRRDRP